MADIPHDWIKSTLGHGETMCLACGITNREAAVLGKMSHCEKRAEGYRLRREEPALKARE